MDFEDRERNEELQRGLERLRARRRQREAEARTRPWSPSSLLREWAAHELTCWLVQGPASLAEGG